MIDFIDVSKSFRKGASKKTVLDGISFSLPARTRLAILGRNGVGKSSFLRLCAGTLRPDSGQIRRNGTISWPLGFGGGLHPALTGRQNARFVARAYGFAPHEVEAFALQFSELGTYFDVQIATYSTGMRARLAFALSLSIPFDLYLIDEITAVGDAAFRRKCLVAFEERLDNAGLIMVSHSVETLRQYCKDGAILNDGKLMFFDDLEGAIESHQIECEAA